MSVFFLYVCRQGVHLCLNGQCGALSVFSYFGWWYYFMFYVQYNLYFSVFPFTQLFPVRVGLRCALQNQMCSQNQEKFISIGKNICM